MSAGLFLGIIGISLEEDLMSSSNKIPSATLTVEKGKEKGSRFVLAGKLTAFGRDPSNHVHMSDEEVSRYHAKIITRDNRYVLADLNSTNGTLVNGQKITEKILESGDALVLGKTVFLFEVHPEGLPGEAEESREPLVQVSQESADRLLSPDESALIRARALKTVPHDSGRRNIQIIFQLFDLVHSASDPDEILHQTVDLILALVPARRAMIFMCNGDSDDLTVFTRSPAPEKPDDNKPQDVSHTIVEYAIDHKTAVLTSNAMTDARFGEKSSVVEHEIRSVLCVPISTARDVYGVIYADGAGSKIHFTEDDLELATLIGWEVGTAIESARLMQAHGEQERLAAVGHVITGLAHWMKNVASSIQVASQLIEDAIDKNNLNNISRGWTRAKRGIDKLLRLGTDLLYYSHEKKLRLEPVNIDEIIEEICELHSSAFKEGGLRLHLETSGTQITVDREAISCAIENVFANAVEAVQIVGEDPRIDVLAGVDDVRGELVVEVADNGPGISEEELAHIFDLFYTTKGMKGTGLGLAVSKHILEAHDGSIQIFPNSPRGTRFVIRLPLKSE